MQCAWIAWMRLPPALWRRTILLSFLYSHCLFPLSALETSSGNRSIYESIRKSIKSKRLYGRWKLHMMGSWLITFFFKFIYRILESRVLKKERYVAKRNCFPVPPISVATIYVASAARFSLPMNWIFSKKLRKNGWRSFLKLRDLANTSRIHTAVSLARMLTGHETCVVTVVRNGKTV